MNTILTRLRYPEQFRAPLRAKAPIVGIPFDGGCFRIERHLLKNFLDNPVVSRAELVKDAMGGGPLTLRLTGQGLSGRVEYKLYTLDHRYGGHPFNHVRETLARWAVIQRKRRAQGKPTPLSKRQAKVRKEIARLERCFAWGRSDPPRNPMLKIGAPVPSVAELEAERAKYGQWYGNVRQDWARSRREKGLRRKVSQLGLQTWKHWQPLRDALAALDATMDAHPKLGWHHPMRLTEVSPQTLITACGLTPLGHEGDAHDDPLKSYREFRDSWLIAGREHKARERKLANLRELLAMPDKLMESAIGLPEGVEMEAICFSPDETTA